MKSLYTNPHDEEVDSPQLCVTSIFFTDFKKLKKSTLYLCVFCHLATHGVQFWLAYTGMPKEFVPFFNINEYHYGYDPLTSPMGTLQRWSVSLRKGNINSEAHCPPYAQRSSAFQSPVTKWLMCIQKTSKCSPKDWDSEWSFYSFDVQSKSAWTHQRLLMTGAGLIFRWSKNSKSVTFARKLMIPP